MELRDKIIVSELADKVEFRKLDREYLGNAYSGHGGLERFCKDVERQLGEPVKWKKGKGASTRFYLHNIALKKSDNEIYDGFRERYSRTIDYDYKGVHEHFFNLFLGCVMLDKEFEDDRQRGKFLNGFGLAKATKDKASIIDCFNDLVADLQVLANNTKFGSLIGVLDALYFNAVLVYPTVKPGTGKSDDIWIIQNYVRDNITTIIGDSN